MSERDNQETGPHDDLSHAAGRLASLINPSSEDEEDDNGEELADDEENADDEAPEEDEEAEGEEDSEAEEGDEPAQAPPGQTHTVKVDGVETQVGLDELKAGYQRQADYTRKSMELADHRRQFAQEVQQVRSDRQKYLEGLNVLQGYLQKQAPKEPDPALRDSDPVEYNAQWAYYQQHREKAQHIAYQQQVLRQQQTAEEDQRLEAHVSDERDKLIKAIPSWKDAAKAKADKAALMEFGKRVGFTDDDLNTVFDHRAVRVLHMAHLYEQLQARKQSLTQQVKQKVANPVAAPPGPARQAADRAPSYTKAFGRLRKTGSERDAAAAIFSLLR